MNSTLFDNYLSYVMSKIPNTLKGSATDGGPAPAPASSVAALPPSLGITEKSILGKAPAGIEQVNVSSSSTRPAPRPSGLG